MVKFNKIFTTLSSLLVFVAAIGVTPMCGGYLYQPKAPKCLTEK